MMHFADNRGLFICALANELIVLNRAQLRIDKPLTLNIVWQLWRGDGYCLDKNIDDKKFKLKSLFGSKLAHHPYLPPSIQARAVALSVFQDINFVVLRYLTGNECVLLNLPNNFAFPLSEEAINNIH